ncbi:MAG: phenylalanine--tRNA ligase subunit beta [Holosporales bacterium]|jgi:phenylalanyl-tRNA synthetase beta chain|nr:phenylalanine--tRNA ligase subunit beta [Holosporales bacterium]
MKFTFDWLKDHLQTDLSYREIADMFTNLGIEVEEILDNVLKFQDYAIGFIRNAKPHPNAERLQICEVDIGDRVLNIVCGADNARSGIYVVVAKVGALIPSTATRLKKSTIRGIESEGMMCSAEELLLEGGRIAGIIELAQDSVIGGNVAQALKVADVVFDISITPNRADCFSVRGLARDLAAAGAGKLLPLPLLNIAENIENPTNVDVRTGNCSYFSTMAIKGISGRTPDYIERRLRAIGQRLIHFPVDIGNYICFDLGQPLHIFDLDKVSSDLIVRESVAGEKLKTLNGEETILPNGAIVIASEDKILSIAGIMGSEASAFSENSRNILIEGAYFDKIAIARAGQFLRINTDSRTRFERGIDPDLVEYSVRYAASLITSNCSGMVSNIKKYGSLPTNRTIVTLTFGKFQALTGLNHEDFMKSKEITERLGMTVKRAGSEEMVIESPSWRHDIGIEEDLIEEVVRIVGYNKIEDQELEKKEPISKVYTLDKIADSLIFNDFYEVKTFSFVDTKTASFFAEQENHILITHPATSEFTTMRPSVIASHLKAIRLAQSKSQKNGKIFEIGKRYRKSHSEMHDLVEENTVTATIAEDKTNRTWRCRSEDVSIFDIKESLEKILNMTVSGFRLVPEAPEYYHPGRSGSYIIQKDSVIAHFGEIHQSVLSELDITGPVVCFELFLDCVPELVVFKQRAPLKLSQYQPTIRDFSFIVKKKVRSADVVNAVKRLKLDYVTHVSIFDVYESELIGSENKAIGFEVVMQSDRSTLTEMDISEISNKIIESIAKNCEGILRQ